MNRRRIVLALFLISCLGAPGCAFLMEDTGLPVQTEKQVPTDLYNKAMSLYEGGRYAQAKELFHQFIGLYPNSKLFCIVLYYLGHCYQMTGEDKEALVLYNRVVTTYGDDDFWGTQAMKRIKQIKGEDEPVKSK